MNNILAIETATEACSVAVVRGDAVHQCHELAERQHSQRLLAMLEEVLPGGDLGGHGIEAIAYGSGPGSFTGLRIAASAVQGLAYTARVPAIPVSTLALQAQTALRHGLVTPDQLVFSAIDARINEIYYAWYGFRDGLAEPLTPAVACAPSAIAAWQEGATAVGVGSGCQFHDSMPATVRDSLQGLYPELLPEAMDLVPLARRLAQEGRTQSARDVQPVYVRDEINWKKIPEQGKRQ